MVFCPECGEEANENTKFCTNCGTSLEKIGNFVKDESLVRERNYRKNYVREYQEPDLKGLDTLIIIGYVLAILGVFVSGILSIAGLIIGIMIYRRGKPHIQVYGLSVETHGLIVILISIVTLIVGIIVLTIFLSIFANIAGFIPGF